MGNYINPQILAIILREGAELGALGALISVGKVKAYLKKSEASRIYGRKNIDHWLAQGLLTLRKDGNDSSVLRIDHLELEAIAKSVLLIKYLNNQY